LLYNPFMSEHLTTFEGSIGDAIREAIVAKLADAVVDVAGQGGHFTIHVVSAAFADKNMLERQRLVYAAITELMAGTAPPVHAVDRLTTATP